MIKILGQPKSRYVDSRVLQQGKRNKAVSIFEQISLPHYQYKYAYQSITAISSTTAKVFK
jgi:hypothetical protein